MKPSRFGANIKADSETIQEFVLRNRLTAEEIAWQQSQPVRGRPSLVRLRSELAKAGFTGIDLQLSADRQDLAFKVRLTGQVVAEDNEALLRLWIVAFRAAGFAVGFEEVGITGVEGTLISGQTLTGPIAKLAEHGAPQIES